MKKAVLFGIFAVVFATVGRSQNIDLYQIFFGNSLSSYNTSSLYSVPSYPSIDYSSISTVSLPTVSYPTPVTYQSSYYRSDGTYVSGHFKTMPNETNWDNFSTVGNVNPYTGSCGTVARDFSSSAYDYGSGHTIFTGPRGGQYYINSNGNKTYVPKR